MRTPNLHEKVLAVILVSEQLLNPLALTSRNRAFVRLQFHEHNDAIPNQAKVGESRGRLATIKSVVHKPIIITRRIDDKLLKLLFVDMAK